MNKKNATIILTLLAIILVLSSTLIYLLTSTQNTKTPTTTQETSSRSHTSSANSDLDHVIAGSGALKTAKTKAFNDVGTAYPATCVGAAQAAAEWSQKVYANHYHLARLADTDINSFSNEVSLVPRSLDIETQKPSFKTIGHANFVAGIGGLRERQQKEPWGVEEDGKPHTQEGFFQLFSCEIIPNASHAYIRTIVPSYRGKNILWNEVSYELREADGIWKIASLIAPYDKVPFIFKERNEQELVANADKISYLPLSEDARKTLLHAYGEEGSHTFANKDKEWGEQ